MSRQESPLLGPRPAGYPTASRRSKMRNDDGKFLEVHRIRYLKTTKPAFFTSFLQWLVRTRHCLAAFFFATGGESKRMCVNYGHVLGAWEPHQLPKCKECGVQIKSADQIRGSNLKS